MKIYGRKLLDQTRTELPVGFDELVFEIGKELIVVSLYHARKERDVEVRSNTGILSVWPRAANVVHIKSSRS
jgi:hypothetical protein